jgi:hypothetical protein
MDFTVFAVAALANWRLAHALAAEDGPWRSLARLRAAAGPPMACFFCISVWPALPLALLAGGGWRVLLVEWPALSAAAILIERAAFPETFVMFAEDEETRHGEAGYVLRAE